MNYLCRIVDVETGGYDPKVAALIEIGWGYLTPEFTVEHADSVLILPQPDRMVHPEAAAINGYTPELWAEHGAVPLAQALEEIEAAWMKHGPQRFGGFNCPFDVRFLVAYAPNLMTSRLVREVTEDEPSYDLARPSRKMLNSLGITKPAKGELTLTGMLTRLGVPRLAGEQHGALEDVLATGRLAQLLATRGFFA